MTPEMFRAGVQIIVGGVLIAAGYLWDLAGMILTLFAMGVTYSMLAVLKWLLTNEQLE